MLRGLLLGAALAIGVANDARAQVRSGAATITVSVPSSVDSTHVEERYVFVPTTPSLELRILTRPCVTIENLQVERDGVALGGSRAQSGPWIAYRDSVLPDDTVRLFVRYDVKHGETGVIPLMHVAAPMARVSVSVRFDDSARRVTFPHMTRQAPAQWSARYAAVPSFVRLSNPLRAECGVEIERGDNGGLVWRFFLLIGIMVAWVPLYLAWARRSGDMS